jgi:hypothetical protein
VGSDCVGDIGRPAGAITLTSSPPQYTLGQVSETTETSICLVHMLMRSPAEVAFCGSTTGTPPRDLRWLSAGLML